MRRCLLVLTLASVAALGQERPLMPSPNVNPNRTKAVESEVRSLFPINAAPDGAVRFEAGPRERTCVVPLLEAQVNPDVDARMAVRPPKASLDRIRVAPGLPPCPGERLK